MKFGLRRNSSEISWDAGAPQGAVFVIDTRLLRKVQKDMTREELIVDYEAKLEFLRNDIRDLVDVYGRFPARNENGRYQPRRLDDYRKFNDSLVSTIASETRNK